MADLRWILSIFGVSSSTNPNEIIAHEWASLEAIWSAIPKNGLAQTEIDKIEAYFPKQAVWASGAEQWYALNKASQAVGRYLSVEQLGIEYPILFALAEQRKLGNVETHRPNLAIVADPTIGNASLDAKKRAAYLSLLDDLQRDFINTRYKRQLRQEVARTMLRTGVIVLVIALLPFVIFATFISMPAGAAPGKVAGQAAELLFSSNPIFGFSMVAGFGLLGAYFSRITQFQTERTTISFDDFMNTYKPIMLWVRLLFGMLGAIIFYFLLRSGILAGAVFPDLDKITIGPVALLKEAVPAGADTPPPSEPSGLTVLLPTAQLAKLLIWSFLAGFTERLVPDALEKTAARSNQAGS